MKLINLLIEKRTLVMSMLLILVFGTLVSGEIKFSSTTVHPQIGGSSGSYSPLKKIEIVTGDEQWPNGRSVHVFIAAGARGLGVGEGTLAPVTILGHTYATHQDGTDKVGTTNLNGSWTYSTAAFVATFITMEIPEDSDQTSFDWSAEGSVKLTPYVWQQSVSVGGTVSLPIAISGSYSTSGTWALSSDLSTTQSAASGTSGTHTVDVKYYCSSCNEEGDTTTAIGGAAAHAVESCQRDGCGVEYRTCDTAAKALHTLCDGCNTYRCDTSTGNIHEKVTCSSTAHVRGRTMTVDACGKEFWACASDSWKHSSTMGPCGGCYKWYKSCMTGEHEWVYEDCPSGHAHSECDGSDHSLQASCPISEEHGEQCTVTNFYACEDPSHTHQFPGSQTGYGSDTGTGSSGSTGSNTDSGSTDLSNTGSGATNATATCRAGHTYYPNQPSSNNLHRTRTCRYPECRQTWERCVSSTPICNKPYRNRNGLNCWAE